MKVAVVTPYYNESQDIINRCMVSVYWQMLVPDRAHIIVSDTEHTIERHRFELPCQIINLNYNHNDAGATPRAIGALSAFSQGFDAVAFLDADNFYDPYHLYKMIQICKERSSDLVSATRNLYSSFDDTFLYTDTIESNGVDFCDTNCLFITKRLMPFMSYWIMSRDLSLAGDRVFWNQIVQDKSIKRFHCNEPTVRYYTKWAWHFQHAQKPIPDDSIWMKIDTTNKVTVHKHKEKQ